MGECGNFSMLLSVRFENELPQFEIAIKSIKLNVSNDQGLVQSGPKFGHRHQK